MQRVTLGKMQNPVRGFLHGSAALLSLIGAGALIARAGAGTGRVVSMAVFGLSLVALYTTSALYHSVPWRQRWKQRLQRLDHSMILVLVAGSWTPLAVNLLDGAWRVTTLSIVWGLALIGVVQKIAWPNVRVWFTITLATTMGWFAVVPLPELARQMSRGALVLLFLGGLFYTLGMVAFASKRPRLFPRVFSYHELFHVMVVAGSTFHFFMVFRYVAPPGL